MLKMSKKIFVMAAIVALALSLVSCNQSSAAAPAGAMTLKFGHVLAPGATHHEGLVKFEELVEARTKGAIQIEIYPSSQLGDEREMIEGMQMGTVDGYYGATASLTAWIPDFMIFDIAFLFDGYEHEYKVMDGELGKNLLAQVAKLDIHPFGLAETGFSNIINNGRPIKLPEDAKGMNIRVMESPGLMAYMTSMGANPVPMAMSEVFTAMQNGTVDGGTWPILTTYFNKLYTVTKYLTLLNPIPTASIFAMSEAVWKKVPDQYKDILTQSGKEAIVYQRDYLAKTIDRLVAEMEKSGMTIVRPDREVWKKALLQKGLDAMVPKYIPQKLVDMVNAAR